MRLGCVAGLVVSITGTQFSGNARLHCDTAGLQFPAGFCATVFADNLGLARHLTVSPAGDVYVALERRGPDSTGFVAALRDSDRDGRSDQVATFFDTKADHIAWSHGYLYVSTPRSIERWPLAQGQFTPTVPAETVVGGFPRFPTPEHSSKPFVFTTQGLLVHVGAPSNTCQKFNRIPRSKGVDPCPLLENSAGVWRFESSKVGQDAAVGVRVASGLRHALGMAVHPVTGEVFSLVHGRDLLNDSWPEIYSTEDSADLPSDELIEIQAEADYGWPYCYHDGRRNMRLLNPEYGGDGAMVGRCSKYPLPLLTFPAHSAPDDLLFFTDSRFPERYRRGAFVALHGGWGRRPFAQRGYSVVFVPFSRDRRPLGVIEPFADGFAGRTDVREPREAQFRPVGLAHSPDGSLFISDSQHGRVWRVTYQD